jgi:predicted DNA-binding ribbon-helix-helix protein
MSGEIRKRSVMIAGHATSVSLEAEFWEVLKEIAEAKGSSLNQMVADIDAGRTGNLSSAIRVFVLAELRQGGRPKPGG